MHVLMATPCLVQGELAQMLEMTEARHRAFAPSQRKFFDVSETFFHDSYDDIDLYYSHYQLLIGKHH